MMKKNEIRKIANKFGWKMREAGFAVKELCESHSIVDCEELLRIVMNTQDPFERWVRAQNFLNKYFILDEHLDKDKLVELICDLLDRGDPCFEVLTLFNAFDSILSRLNEDPKKIIRFPGDKKSFLDWRWTLNPRAVFRDRDKLPQVESLFFPNEVTWKFLDRLLHQRKIFGMYISNLGSLLIEVIARVGFLAFNIQIFREYVTFYSGDPTKREELLELVNALNDPFLDRTKNTERKYWLFFLLVEKLKREYGVRGAFREVGNRLNVSPGLVHGQYYVKKKAAKKQFLKKKERSALEFDLDAITNKFHLERYLENYLTSANNF